MFLLKQILPAAIISMLVAAGVCGFAFFKGAERTRIALGPLAVGAAYVAGHLFVAGWIAFPPTDTTNWLPFFALAIAVLSVFCRVLAIRAWVCALIFFLVSMGALKLLLKPRFEYGWSLTEGYAWVVLLAGAMVLVTATLSALMQRPVTVVDTVAIPLIICAGTIGALVVSGSMLLGQFAVVLGAAVLGSLFFPTRKVLLPGIVPVFSFVLVTLLLSGYFFAELPASSAALIGFAPVLALMPIGTLAHSAFPVRAILVSLPIVVALALAFHYSPPLSY